METSGDRISTLTVRNTVLLILLAAFLLTFYTLTHSGSFRVDDEHILMSRAISLHETGELADTQVYGNQRVRDLYALEDAATQVEPAQAVLAQPFLWAAALFNLGYTQVLFWMTTFLTAAAAVVTAASVLLAGYEKRTAVWIVLLFGLGTIAASYADTFYRDSQAMFFSALAFLGMLLWLKRSKAFGILLFLAAAALGVFTKNNVLMLVPAWAVGLLLEYKNLKKRWDWPTIRTGFWLLGGSALIGLAAVLVLPDKGPLARFNSSYYLFLIEFFRDSITPQLLVNFLGPLFSPAKSVFLFSPPLLLAVFGLKRNWLKMRGYTAAVLVYTFSLIIVQALFFREEWAGGFGWGLRFLLPTLPMLMVLAAEPVQHFLASDTWRRFLPMLFLFAGGIVNLAGAVVNWLVPYRIWIGQGLNPYDAHTVWKGSFLTIPAQIAGLFHLDNWNLGWLRVVQQGLKIGFLVPVLGLIFFFLLAVQMKRLLNEKTMTFREITLLGLLAGVGCMMPFFPGLWIANADPYWCACDRGFQQTIEYVQSGVEPGDVIVFDSYGTDHWHCWLNDWREPLPWYSLRYEIAGPSSSEEGAQVPDLTADLLSSLGQQYNRLWYLNSSQSPDYSVGEESEWLQERFQQRSIEVFSDVNGEIQAWLFELD